MITPEELREYASRDWKLLADRTVRRAAERWRAGGPMECLRVSLALHAHAKRVVAGYPSVERRERDRAEHLIVSSKLDRVAHLFRDA